MAVRKDVQAQGKIRKTMKRNNRNPAGKKVRIGIVAALLSVLTMLLFHLPFFRHAAGQVEPGFNGKMILLSLGVILLAGNYLFYYLLLYIGRIVGKLLISFLFIGNAIGLYFINTYDIMIDDSMMGNVFNTNYAEATSYWSFSALLYILLTGAIPIVLIWLAKTDYGKIKRFLKSIGLSLLTVLVAVFANMPNWMWIDKNSTVLGSLILPWSYVVNTFRYYSAEKEKNREEILLPDATILNDDKDVLVLVIGESARRDHFSLYGYERDTNPLLSKVPNLTVFKANSSATYTTAGVKAMLDYTETDMLYEILPNYLYRNGVDVIWRSSNWGQPPLHIRKFFEEPELQVMYPDAQSGFDGLLTEGLKEAVTESGNNKVLLILHTSTSHGPSYNKKYPPEFEVFSPVCNTVEMSKAPIDELINAYDNTIVYTDWLLDRIIGDLKELDGWKSCMMFVSDHGESLGENNLYMHGVPMSIAPKEQYEIPFIVWTSDSTQQLKPADMLSQYNVFHSVLHFLGIGSPVYDERMNIFR